MREFFNSFQKLEFQKIKQYLQRYALSEIGKEHIDNLTPSSDIDIIASRLALVTEMKRLLEEDDALPLETVHDIRINLQRTSIANYFLSSEELNKVAMLLQTSRLVRTFFSKRNQQYPLLSQSVEEIYQSKVLEYNIHQAIDEEGRVKDSASKELAAIRRKINDRNVSLRKKLESVMQSVSGKEWIQEEIITTREGRMVIPVKVEHKNHIPGFIHSASASGATVFIEPMETLEINNEIRTLQFEEKREVESILKGLTTQIGEDREKISSNIRVLGELDFIQAKAKYSIDIFGNEPRISLKQELKLYGAYHPILLKRVGRSNVIPLDIEIDETANTIVITGPNAGGKSVAMKTIGLLTVLAQAGCHIPASSESIVRICTDIFVDIGDDQSIENDLSSFSSHLEKLKIILKHANSSSLILIDEIGSGTDPLEGSSLAAAFLENITTIGSINIVTTHHGNLKTFAFEHRGMENGAMEFDAGTLKPTYRFRKGIPGSSYAIEMAERMSLPPEIIHRAMELKGSDAIKLERLIIDLESRTQHLNETLERVSNEKFKLDELIKLYESKLSSLQKEIKTVKAQAADEAQLIIEKSNTLIENAIKEIREASAKKEVVRKVKEDIHVLNEQINIIKKDFEESDNKFIEFNVGDRVRIKSSQATGTIQEKLGGDQFLLIIGEMKVKVHLNDLQLTDQEIVKVRTDYIENAVGKEYHNEIDLRGMYGEEAVAAVDKFLDDAMLAGLHRVDIIHGKGTGALRKRISEHLKTLSIVKSFRLGEWNEGGGGVTVVELA